MQGGPENWRPTLRFQPQKRRGPSNGTLNKDPAGLLRRDIFGETNSPASPGSPPSPLALLGCYGGHSA